MPKYIYFMFFFFPACHVQGLLCEKLLSMNTNCGYCGYYGSLTSSYMKSGSELLANRSVLVSAWSAKEQFWNASPKGGSIPLMLGYKMKTRSRRIPWDLFRNTSIYIWILRPNLNRAYTWGIAKHRSSVPWRKLFCHLPCLKLLIVSSISGGNLILSLKEKVLVFNKEALAAHLRMAELSSSVHCCLWKENKRGERLASTNVTITSIICANTSVQNRTLSLCSLVKQVYNQHVTYKLRTGTDYETLRGNSCQKQLCADIRIATDSYVS